MSALFGKKNYEKTIEAYVNKGVFGTALKVAIEAGDRLYERGDKEEALFIYTRLLELYNANGVSDHNLYEKLYEKVIPLLFEFGRKEEAINFSLLLVDEKVVLGKTEEAKSILDELLSEYKENEAVILKNVEFNLSKGDLNGAFSILKKAVSDVGAKPKFIELSGEILMKLHKFKDAYDYYNALLAIEPNNALAERRISEIQASMKLNEIPETETFAEGETQESIEKKVSTYPLIKKRKVQEKIQNVPKVPGKKILKVKEGESKTLGEKESEEGKEILEGEKEKVTTVKETPKTVVDNLQFIVFGDSAYKETINKILIDREAGFKKLFSLARRYETLSPIEAEYLYHKLLLIHPDRKEIYDNLISLYEKNNRKEDEVLILRLAADNCTGNDKLTALRKLETMRKDNLSISKEIFDAALENADKETAVEYFVKLKDKSELFKELAQKLYPVVKDDLRLLEVVTLKVYEKNRKGEITFKYCYTLGTMYFNMGSQPEGLKWLMRAHSISSLPLDDCIKVAEYIKELPLDSEQDVIANALNGYINTVTEENRKEYIYKLMLSLKPSNSLYLKSYITFLEQKGKLKEMSALLKKLVGKMDANSADFISNKIPNVAEYFSDEELIKAAELLEASGNAEGVSKIYKILLEHNPDNPAVAVKLLHTHVEMEDATFIVSFFKENNPSHKYANIVNSTIVKLENKRASSPIDYHLHFVLGFMYFLVERFEEAIASFQFVARSHHSEALMHFFIGTSFEKIGLPDFAFKQYEMVVHGKDASSELKEQAYYEMAILKKKSGSIKEAIGLAKEALKINPESSSAKKLIGILPEEENKITKLEGD